MATARTHIRRIAAAGALTLAGLAALTGPALAALGGSTTNSATGNCLAWFGSRDDGICMGYSNGQPTYIGTPQGGWLGPGYGVGLPGSASSTGGFGVSSGPLLPGQTINTPIGGS